MEHVFRGDGPPTLPPQASGLHYIDTTNKCPYMSVGSDSVTDWKPTMSNLIGYGPPEGVVSAPPGVKYFDATNKAEYTKLTGYSNTGWS